MKKTILVMFLAIALALIFNVVVGYATDGDSFSGSYSSGYVTITFYGGTYKIQHRMNVGRSLRDVEFDSGSYTISGKKITLRGDQSKGDKYTIVNSTTIKDKNGHIYSKEGSSSSVGSVNPNGGTKSNTPATRPINGGSNTPANQAERESRQRSNAERAEAERIAAVEAERIAAAEQAEAERQRQIRANSPVTADMFQVRQNLDNTITITGYTGDVENVVIPSTLHGLKVTHIGDDAFRGGRVRSVVIPDTVVEIGGGAFYGSYSDKIKLTNVTIGKSVRKIGASAFYAERGGGLTEITIPDSVIEIGSYAFADQHSLTRITFGKGLQTIGAYAFSETKLTSITLPVGLKTIGVGAFRGGHKLNDSVGYLVSVSIPAGIVVPVNSAIFEKQYDIVHVTLPANLSDAIMKEYWFEDGLRNFYANQGRAAGSYVKNGPIWTRQ